MSISFSIALRMRLSKLEENESHERQDSRVIKKLLDLKDPMLDLLLARTVRIEQQFDCTETMLILIRD